MANELPCEGALPVRFLGFDFHRCNNLLWVSSQEFVFISGHVLTFVNINSKRQFYLHGRDNGGIGAVDISSDGYLAVGEKSTSGAPNVYIYTYPQMTLERTLRKGTERGYASVQFSPHNKDHLAALGCAPDYLLSVWDWQNERLLLKCKAYGQDVFSIRWGQFPGMLTSVGVGHIRFWKMATTFTGLKLQGDIGKFGATELSDINGFVELPDGKVVTGTEYGKLLLWEGVFVKVELTKSDPSAPRVGAFSPHAGAVDVILMDQESRCIVSGGDDGYLRWWPIEEADEAEADYDNGILEYGISLRKEFRVPPLAEDAYEHSPAHIMHVARSSDDATWLIQDVRNGVVWRFDKATGACEAIFRANSAQVTGVVVMPSHPGLVISSCMDGTLRSFNIGADRENILFMDRKPIGITTLTTVPEMVDPEHRTVSCGYTDGTLRIFSICIDGFILLQALKPHNCMIKQLLYTKDGDMLASLGEDNTIFIFELKNLQEGAVPLGFVQMPSKVNSLSWRARTGHLMLAMEDGTIIDLVKPRPDTLVTTETYLINLSYKQVLPDVPEIEESDDEEEEEVEGEEGQENPEGEPQEVEEAPPPEEPQGEASPEGEGTETKKKKKKKEKEKAEEGEEAQKQDIPSAVSHLVSFGVETTFGAGDCVLFVGTGKYSGALWEIAFDELPELDPTKVPLASQPPPTVLCKFRAKLPKGLGVSFMTTSPSKRFIHIGFADGRAWVVPVENLNSYSCLAVADSATGSINAVHSDPEDTMVLVGGGDGSLTCLSFNGLGLIEIATDRKNGTEDNVDELAAQLANSMPPLPAESPKTWSLPEAEAQGAFIRASDITEPDFYSIQDAKLKSEADHAKAAAEVKKKRLRDRIEDIRQELEEFQAKNLELGHSRLDNQDMILDQEYIAYLNQDMEAQIEQVRFELAWTVEYHERGLQKLKECYLNHLDFERIEVLGFASPHRVATFRCQALSAELQGNLAKLHELIAAADDGDDEDDDDDDESPGYKSRKSGAGTRAGGSDDGGFDGSDAGGSASKEIHLSGAEQRALRKEQRLQRRQAMQDLEKAKPSDSYEDPQDVEAIATAEATLGNIVLKTSEAYQVPENQRMNAEKKRRQMFLLEESMHAIKTEFNQRVHALRDFRQQVREEVKRDLLALREIDQQLGTTTEWVDGLLDDPEGALPEFPERRMEINETQLKEFERKLRGTPQEEEPAAAVAEEPLENGDGPEQLEHEGEEYEEAEEEEEEAPGDEPAEGEEEAAADSGERQSAESAAESPPALPSKSRRREPPPKAAAESTRPVLGRAALSARKVARLTLRAKLQQEREDATPLDKAVAEEALARLRHDKAQLEEHIHQVIDTFNNAVASIEKEKAKLESDLKNADLKLLVLYEELMTLNELEERDEALLKKTMKCRQDKASVMHQIKECQDQLAEKKAEIETWHTEEQSLQAEFTELVGEGSQFLGALLKIYKKKVKRSKRKKQGEEEDFDEDEDDEDEEEDLESDEDEDEMEEDTGPPQGCDVQIYESVLDLREKRLDMEDALQEIQKAVEELKRTHKKLLDDERRIDKEQKQTDHEIQQFQTDKQRKLNQVPIVFSLRLSQVQCLEATETGTEKLPEELNQHVVFTNEALQRLQARIGELHGEIRDVKLGHKQLQKDYHQRKKEKIQVNRNLEDLQAKLLDIQMLKFGQTVNLDLIERSGPNKYIEELQEKVAQVEADCNRRLADWEKKIEKQRKELAKVTQDNTSLMEQIVSMGYSQMQLDSALNARIANVTVNDTEPLMEMREMERERLKDLLALQTKEIQTLQAEINLFRKKGGHIYTTVTTKG